MSPKGAAILANPHPCGHIVYPYTDENLVAQAVYLYASAGLRDGDAVVLIMTKAHREPIDRRLIADGFDTAELQRAGRLTYLVAEDLLTVLTLNGMPDEALFKSIIGRVLEHAQKRAESHKVRAFGELVSLVWVNNAQAAERLEQMWDGMIKHYSISLLCTYALGDRAPSALPAALISCHTDNIAQAAGSMSYGNAN